METKEYMKSDRYKEAIANYKSRINLELMEFKYLSGITGQGFNSSYNKVN